MEPEASSPHSQAPATFPYPEPVQSSPHTLIPPPEGHKKKYWGKHQIIRQFDKV